MRKLSDFEIPFWNETSMSIIIDAGIIVELNDGKVVGIGLSKDEADK